MATMKVDATFTWAAEAGADLTGSLNLLVKLDVDGTLKLAGANEVALGPIIEVPLAASSPYGPASIQTGGIAKMIASAAIPAGSKVSPAAGGKIAAGSTNVIGRALEAASANNNVITVQMGGV